MNRRTFLSGAVMTGALGCSSKETAKAAVASKASAPPAAAAQKVITLTFDISGLTAAAIWTRTPRLDVLLLDGKAGGLDHHAPALMVRLDDVESYHFAPAEEPTVLTIGGQDFAYWSLMDRVVTVNGYDDPGKADITFPAAAGEKPKKRPDDPDNASHWTDRHWLVPLHEICKTQYAEIKNGKYIAARVRLFNGRAECIRPKLKGQRRRLFAFSPTATPPFQQHYSTGFRASQDLKDADSVSLTFHQVLTRQPEQLGLTAGTIVLRPSMANTVVVSISNTSLGHQSGKNHFGIYYDLTALTAQKPKKMCYSENDGATWKCDDRSDKPARKKRAGAPNAKIEPDAPSPFCIPPSLEQP